MALHWENLSSTTPSLTPRPPNRPLKIVKLTPCKKPEVAGSAGHCEPGVGRFTDPHPFTCYNITPSVCWLMFGQCPLPSALSKPDLRVEKNSLFNEANPALLCAAFAGPAGPAFFFLPFLLPVHLFSPSCVDGLAFSHPGLPLPPDSFTTGSHGFNRAGLGLRWCHFLTWLSKSHTGPHRGEFCFSAFFS